MTVQNYKNVIPKNIIDNLFNFFITNTHLHRDTMSMIKISSPWQYVVDILDPILYNYIDTSDNLGDNFYRHSFPYFTHTDSNNSPNSYNVLIPLYVENDAEQKFIIFDQYSKDYSSATWIGDLWKPSGNFETNKTKRGFPYQDPKVIGCTKNPIDPNLYKDLKFNLRNEEMFFGLTGKAYDYIPGDLLIFPSNRLHCTGRMLCKYKIGLSLRFNVN